MHLRGPVAERCGGQPRRHRQHGRAAHRHRRRVRRQHACRRADRGLAHRLHRLCLVGRRADPAPQHRRLGGGADRLAHAEQPAHRAARRRADPHHRGGRARRLGQLRHAGAGQPAARRPGAGAALGAQGALSASAWLELLRHAAPQAALVRGSGLVLRRLALRDFVIVPSLELEFHAGFSVLTGETGAGKSILVDGLQLALGSRGDVGVVREGAARAEVSAEFDMPASLAAWLDAAGFVGDEPGTLLLRRTVDAQGKSRAWINGSPATVTQLREAADHLLDIHGQHAWQSLTRAAATRELLDLQAGLSTIELVRRFAKRKAATDALAHARERGDELLRERERLAWQINEVDKLAPGDGEWDELNAEHQRLAHAQALIDAARAALQQVADADEGNAEALTSRAIDALGDVAEHDARIATIIDALQGALAQLQDASHSLNAYLDHADLDPRRLAELDDRMSAWVGLARRYRRPPAAPPHPPGPPPG